jgi:hypothetical protein
MFGYTLLLAQDFTELQKEKKKQVHRNKTIKPTTISIEHNL